jgi:hypothetical protein
MSHVVQNVGPIVSTAMKLVRLVGLGKQGCATHVASGSRHGRGGEIFSGAAMNSGGSFLDLPPVHGNLAQAFGLGRRLEQSRLWLGKVPSSIGTECSFLASSCASQCSPEARQEICLHARDVRCITLII